MLSVSPEYKTAIASSARKIFGQVKINFTDVFLDPTTAGLEISASNRVSQLDQVINGRSDMTAKWFELSGETQLDGTYKLCPGSAALAASNEIGWWGDLLSGAGGAFSTAQEVASTFAERRVTSLFVAFDNKRNEYGVDFDLLLYSGATLLSTVSVTGNTDTLYTQTISALTDVDKIVISISKWSKENAVAKVAELTTAVITDFQDDVIQEMTILEQREVANDNFVPIGAIANATADISLINKNRLFDNFNPDSPFAGLIKPNAKIDVSIGVKLADGSVEYVPVFTGWARDWNVPESGIGAFVSAADRLSLLEQTTVEIAAQEDITFGDWFALVFTDAGLAPAEYAIDAELYTTPYTIPIGWLENVTHRVALEQLAQACSGVVYVDRQGIIQAQSLAYFGPESRTAVKTVTRSDYMDKSNGLIYSNIVNRAIVRTAQVSTETGVTLYETDENNKETISGSTTTVYRIFFDRTPASAATVTIDPAVTGLSILSTTVYPWGADVTVQNTSVNRQEFQLKATGGVYTFTTGRASISENADSITNNGVSEYQYPINPFLQNSSLADIIAGNIVASFSDPASDLEISFEPGGDPALEMSDRIDVTDRYTTKGYNLIETNIRYNGGLSVGHKARFTGDYETRGTTDLDTRITTDGDTRVVRVL